MTVRCSASPFAPIDIFAPPTLYFDDVMDFEHIFPTREKFFKYKISNDKIIGRVIIDLVPHARCLVSSSTDSFYSFTDVFYGENRTLPQCAMGKTESVRPPSSYPVPNNTFRTERRHRSQI